jgi:type IV secretion system protein VirD4
MDIVGKGISMLAIGGMLSVIIPVSVTYWRTKKAQNQRVDLHGSAHWADDKEIKETGLLPDEKNAGGSYALW